MEKYVDGHYTLDYPAETMEDTVIICKVEPYCSFEQDKHIKPLIENAPKLYEALKRIANPIDSIKKEGLKEGLELNGNVAIQLADDANYLKEIAKKALRCLEGDKDS